MATLASTPVTTGLFIGGSARQTAETMAIADPARLEQLTQAYAQAEKLRRDAEAASGRGDHVAAQILGEHSLAAYDHAFALTRYVKAEQRLALAEEALAKAQA